MTPPSLDAYTINNANVRTLERASILEFVQRCALYLTGDVLDLGCGLQPYRPVVEDAGGAYYPFDRVTFPANVSLETIGDSALDPSSSYSERWRWDAVLTTQVIQYVPHTYMWLESIRWSLKHGGHLILTGPTTWAEVEREDLCRFTLNGITRLLSEAGFDVLIAEHRAVIDLGGFQLPIGYGILARNA